MQPESPLGPDQSSVINPYRPSPSTSEPSQVEPLLPTAPRLEGCIHFEGSPDQRDVDELLRLTAIRGLAWMVLLPIVFVCLAVGVNASWPWTMAAVGMALLLLVIISILGRSYRRADFYAFNPQWYRATSGTLDRSGYCIHSAQMTERVSWPGVANAYESDELVAFQCIIRTRRFHLIPRHAVGSEKDWALLRQAARGIDCENTEVPAFADRVARISASRKAPDDDRVIQPPPLAITFAGPVTGRELREHDFSVAQSRIFMRSLFYAVVGLVGFSAVLTGLTGLLYQQTGQLPNPTNLLALISLGVFSVFGLWLVSVYLREWSSKRIDHFIRGFATHEGLTLEVGFAARTTSWSAIQIIECDNQRIRFCETAEQCFTTIRSDMFASHDDWNRFVHLAQTRVGVDFPVNLAGEPA